MTIHSRADMIGQNDVDSTPKEIDETHMDAIKKQLVNELTNGDLQVYGIDNKNVDVLINELVNLISRVYLQVWEKAETDRSLMIVDVLKMFLSLKTKSLTSAELLNQSNIGSLYKLRRYILEPIISAGYIKMSNPEKPTSSKQRYLLTETGRSLFGQ